MDSGPNCAQCGLPINALDSALCSDCYYEMVRYAEELDDSGLRGTVLEIDQALLNVGFDDVAADALMAKLTEGQPSVTFLAYWDRPHPHPERN